MVGQGEGIVKQPFRSSLNFSSFVRTSFLFSFCSSSIDMSVSDLRNRNSQLQLRLAEVEQERDELLHDVFGYQVTSAFLNVIPALSMEFCNLVIIQPRKRAPRSPTT